MEGIPSRQANNYSSGQEVPCLSWNPKVDYHVHKSLSLAPILSQMNPVSTFPPYFPKIYSDKHKMETWKKNHHIALTDDRW